MSDPLVFKSSVQWDDLVFVASTLSMVGDLSTERSIAQRRFEFARRVAEFVKADIWTWFSGSGRTRSGGNAIPTSILDDGWKSPEERSRTLAFLTDSRKTAPVLTPVGSAILQRRYATFLRHDLVTADAWEVLGKEWRNLDIQWFLMAVYPVHEGAFSTIGFFRRAGSEDFTSHAHAMVHLLFQQVDWLHGCGGEVDPRVARRSLRLPPRQRQVLMLLQAGDSNKIIAKKMGISPHTVGDYVKDIYRYFDVTSRSELLAKFIVK